jgi:quercetin 2,3-dioxygenase
MCAFQAARTFSPNVHRDDLQIRKSSERNIQNLGNLKICSTFSSAEYLNPQFIGYRSLRSLNEFYVQPSAELPPHLYQETEILTYVMRGTFLQRHAQGKEVLLEPGEFQRMSTGIGIDLEECNASSTEPLHLIQVWFNPEVSGLTPSYEHKKFPDQERTGNLRLVASKDGRAGSLRINQDVFVYSSILIPGEVIEDRLPENRHTWIQVVRGILSMNGQILNEGDGAALEDGGPLELKTPFESRFTEILLFDLA